MAVLSIDTVSGFTEGITGGFVCESLTVGVHPQVERLPRNGIKIAEELNAFAFCTEVADKADRTSFSTDLSCHHNAVTGLVDRYGALPAFGIAVAPFLNLFRIITEAAGSQNHSFAVDSVSSALGIFSYYANDLAVFRNEVGSRGGNHCCDA